MAKLLGSLGPGIILQTRLGNDVENENSVQLTYQHVERFKLLVKLAGERWEIRRPPNASYNCAGHVWASRRTCIYDEKYWRLILNDDGYRRTDNPLQDDLVIYIDVAVGILHIGRVVEFREGITPESRRIPWVVSKLDATSGEVIHAVHDVPFERIHGFSVNTEFWTDRPSRETR